MPWPELIPGRVLPKKISSRKEIVVGHTVRASDPRYGRKCAKRHHVAVLISRIKSTDLIGLHSIIGVRLNVYLIGASEEIEIVHVIRPEISLQRIEDAQKGDAQTLHLRAVNIYIQLRHLRTERAEHLCQSRLSVSGTHQLVCYCLQLAEPKMASIFDLELESADRTNALDRRRRKGRDDRFLDARCSFRDCAHNSAEAFARGGSVMKRLKEHEYREAIRLCTTG